MNNLLNRIVRYSFYLLFILAPLILTPYNYELFEFNKMLTVYFLTTIIAGTWIIKMILAKRILIRRTPFDLPLLLFLVSQVISTILSIDPHTSVWGYYSRFHGGLLSTISYLILYYAYVSNITKDGSKPSAFVNNSLKVILSTGLIVSIYGILEHFGIDKHLWVQDVQNRVFSTLGQPNWLAAYLICLTPLSIFFFLKYPKKPQILYLITTLIFYITLLFTKSRSGLVGFSNTYLTFWGLILLSRSRFYRDRGSSANKPGKQKLKAFPVKKFLTLSLSLLITTLIIGTPYTPSGSELMDYKGKNTAKIESSEPSEAGRTVLDRKVTEPSQTPSDLGPPAIAAGGSKSSHIRKVVWQGALNIWRQYPIFGSGVETFAYAYYNHRPTEHNLLSEWDFLYNKAHNEFLNFLSTTGAFGLFSYLLLITWFAVYCLKNLKSNPLIPALLAAYLGLAVSNFFGFSVVPVALFFFLFPALAISHGRRTVLNRRPERISSRDSEAGRTVLIGFVSLITLYLLYSIINLWRADRIFNLGRNYLKSSQISTGHQYAQKAVDLSPNEPLFRNQLAEASAKMAVLYHQSEATNSTQIRDQLITEAIAQSNQTLDQNKVHLNFHKSKIKIYLLLSTIDNKYYQQTLDAMLTAINLAPTDAKLFYNLGLLYSKIGQTGLAEQTLKETINLKSNYEAARFALGSLYRQTNRLGLARQQYEYILKHLNPDNQTVIQNLKKL